MKKFLFLLLIFNLSIQYNDMDKDLDKALAEAKSIEQKQYQVPSNKFSLDKFLKEMDELECDQERSNDSIYKETFNELCEQNLEENAVAQAGGFREGGDQFFNFLNENIYMPLAYDVQRKNSISEQLIDLINLNDNHVKLDKDNMNIDFDSFEKEVLQHFMRLEATSSKPLQQQQIMENMINILKTFHVHWNSLRMKDQMSRAKGETQNLMRKILQQYEIKEKFQFEIVKTIIDKVKLAYEKFVGADQKFQLLKIKAPFVMARYMIIQYQIVANNIKFGKVHEIQFVQKLSTQGQLLKQFYLGTYQIGYSEQKCVKTVEDIIEKPIRKIYAEFMEKFDGVSQKNKDDLKYFTAILLLKMKYVYHKLFRVEGILSILSRPIVDLDVKGINIIKLFFELKDLLMIIPQKCVNYLQLKNCAYFQMNKVLKFIAGKYKLKRSTGGWSTYNYLVASFQDMFKEANAMVWGNFTLFKNYYYQNLFSMVKNMKYKYIIFEDADVTDLEDSITQRIREFLRDFEDKDHLNHALVDKMEKQLYLQFVNMKALFNGSFPIRTNGGIISQIYNNVLKFMKEFQKKYKDKINDNFVELLEAIKKVVFEWKEYIPKKMDYTIQISELPLSSPNLYPQVFHTILQNPTDPKYDYTIQNKLPDYTKGKNNQTNNDTQQVVSGGQLGQVQGSSFGKQYITEGQVGIQQYPAQNEFNKLEEENRLEQKQKQMHLDEHQAQQLNDLSKQDDEQNLHASKLEDLQFRGQNQPSEDVLQNSAEDHEQNQNSTQTQNQHEHHSEEEEYSQMPLDKLEQKKHDLYNQILQKQQQLNGTYNLENLHNTNYINKNPKLQKELQDMYQKMNQMQQINNIEQQTQQNNQNLVNNQNDKTLKAMIRTQIKQNPEQIVDELYKRIVEKKDDSKKDIKKVVPMYVDHVPYSAETIQIQPEQKDLKLQQNPVYEQLINYHTLPNFNFQNKVKEYMDTETQGGIV